MNQLRRHLQLSPELIELVAGFHAQYDDAKLLENFEINPMNPILDVNTTVNPKPYLNRYPKGPKYPYGEFLPKP